MFPVIYQPLFCNYEPKPIKVEFLTLHYSSASLSHTLDIFQNPKSKASSHLVICRKGLIYELVACLKGQCFKAWHAGDSRWKAEGKTWTNFNNLSIGVELINQNGNLFPYTEQQYGALKQVLHLLKAHYPALRDPSRIVGHEHIASHRGKVDPGHSFNWPLFFKMNYSQTELPKSGPIRKPLLKPKQRLFFKAQADRLLKKTALTQEDWTHLNTQMEQSALNTSV